jgi:hypothetical protein
MYPGMIFRAVYGGLWGAAAFSQTALKPYSVDVTKMSRLRRSYV